LNSTRTAASLGEPTADNQCGSPTLIKNRKAGKRIMST
jgi:hypothetical protein